jgi:hypothetical protein
METNILKVASGLHNNDRFPTTLSMHGVWLLLQGLRAAIADLPEVAKLEGHDYANMVGSTLITEARHLLHTVRLISLNDPDYVADTIKELESFADDIPSFPAWISHDNHTWSQP